MAGVDWKPRAGLEQKPGVRAAQLAQLELSGEHSGFSCSSSRDSFSSRPSITADCRVGCSAGAH